MNVLLIAQGADELRSALSDRFEEKYQVSTCSDGDTALELIRTLKPNMLILDLMLPKMDGLTLLQKAASDTPSIILATTRLTSDYVLQTAKDLGVGYLMMMPCSVNAMAQRFEDMVRYADLSHTGLTDPQTAVSACLSELGISSKLSGFRQLRIAVPLYAQDPKQLFNKELYPAVAERCGCNDGRQVERSIRKAIETAWMQRDETTWSSYFAPDSQGNIPHPSNKLFISAVAEMLISRETDIQR